ncbi:hypothetical protein LZ30DRAFT_173191 [Colletotrichum cereale]|nr:hypothetical protein LZ30DRAFT_173191 [Colletotrichum cereale]
MNTNFNAAWGLQSRPSIPHPRTYFCDADQIAYFAPPPPSPPLVKGKAKGSRLHPPHYGWCTGLLYILVTMRSRNHPSQRRLLQNIVPCPCPLGRKTTIDQPKLQLRVCRIFMHQATAGDRVASSSPVACLYLVHRAHRPPAPSTAVAIASRQLPSWPAPLLIARDKGLGSV